MRRFAPLLRSTWAVALFLCGTAGGQDVPDAKTRSEDARAKIPTVGESARAIALREEVHAHLKAGRIEAALKAGQTALARSPADGSIRREVVALHFSLARNMLAEENFAVAEQALDALLKIEANHAGARRLKKVIADARAKVPPRLEEAGRWLRLEWFEPAFNTFRQATALRPTESARWAEPYRAAALGSGDDHYLTRNFHEAFYYYDAAVKLGTGLGIQPSESLVSRWLQCMVHALAVDVGHARYPPSYWESVLRRAERMPFRGSGGKALRAVLRGLSYENRGQALKAAGHYAKAARQTPSRVESGDVAKLRDAALVAIRRWYDVDLTDRRKGFWSRTDGDDWQVFDTRGFTIRHHNARVARHVAEALQFHFDRIASALAMDRERIVWSLPCTIYLHEDRQAFREATDQPDHVLAISAMRNRRGELQAHAIHAFQTDPMLLSSSLAHELAHLVVGAVTAYRPFPAVINEGIALHIEPQCRRRQFARLFRRIEKPKSVSALLRAGRVHPPDRDFYGEAFRLMEVLLERGDLATVVETSRGGIGIGDLAGQFRFESSPALERMYRDGGR